MEQQITELLQTLNNYFQNVGSQPSAWEFIVTIICPIVSTLALVIGGGFAVYKYRAAQNYDINLKILNEVYMPLYSYLVKQETFRYVACAENSWDNLPILELKSTKTKFTWNANGQSFQTDTSTICDCDRDALISICENTNLGLASSELASLLNSYKVLCHIVKDNPTTKEHAKAQILLLKVEKALCEEIIRGYNHYHKKLKLHKSKNSLYKSNGKQITINLDVSEDEINAILDNQRCKDAE